MNLKIGIDLVIGLKKVTLNCPKCLDSVIIYDYGKIISCPVCKEDHVLPDLTIADKLKLLRLKKKKTTEELSLFLGVSVHTLRNWINGRFSPNSDHLDRLNIIFEEEGINWKL